MAKKPLIGLDQFHYALENYDTTAGISYQTPIALKGAITVTINENSEIATLDADDGVYDSEGTSGPIEIDVGIADISQEDYAALMGHTITGGVMSDVNTDTPPYVAFGFRAKRSNSGYSYFWLVKGKFAKPNMDHETKGSTIAYQTPTFNGKFINRTYDGRKKYSTRDDADDYTASIGTNWFASVYGTTADTTAPAYSSSIPSANSTTATQTTSITITFSEALLSSTVTASNFTLIQATSATTYTAAISLSTGGETVTLTPPADLTSAATYNVVISTGVKDEAGNNLSGSVTFWFQTT